MKINENVVNGLINTVEKQSSTAVTKADKKYLKYKNATVTSYDETTSIATVKFPDIEKEYNLYNKTGEVLAEHDSVKVEYTNNLSQGVITIKTGVWQPTEIPTVELVGGEGVGRPSPWDITSEYFNEYTGQNIAGTEGKTGYYAHAQGLHTWATGLCSHAEGSYTTASGSYCHAEGENTSADGIVNHVEGQGNHIPDSATHTHMEGGFHRGTIDTIGGHIEGYEHLVTNGGVGTHIEGRGNTLSGNGDNRTNGLHIEGNSCKITNSINGCHVEGYTCTITDGASCHAQGLMTNVSGTACHGEGQNCTVSGTAGHVEGMYCTVSGDGSHAEGNSTNIAGIFCHGEGIYGKIENGTAGHVEGIWCSISGVSTREGNHAEGVSCSIVNGRANHVEGSSCTAEGTSYSHVGGEGCKTVSSHSFMHGYYLIDYSSNVPQTILGKYNKATEGTPYAFSIGNGTSATNRSNCFSIDYDGNVICNSITSQGDANLLEQAKEYTNEKVEEHSTKVDEEFVSVKENIETNKTNIAQNTETINTQTEDIASLKELTEQHTLDIETINDENTGILSQANVYTDNELEVVKTDVQKKLNASMIKVINHSPTENDLTGGNCLIFQCDTNSIVDGTSTKLYSITNIFYEK